MYVYSAIKNSFFPKVLMQNYINSGNWPDDGIEVDEDIFSEFAGNIPPEGKIRVAGEDGLPRWADVAPPTKEEIQYQAEVKKKKLMVKTQNKIAPLQDAIDLRIATEEEELAYNELRKYRVMLNRVDCKTAPNIQWPEQPK
ncbi:tail fiber assembly protein [Xenorhabdus sp. 12]|uniref:Tail fiber assembly protein n=1 Tax=Xenorhabdus santafensis TaxID=2582833 RepID=A0ABU4SF72_9GAMM|nr:tail fiber assembly protein [Xenorhabdus sp. 12]MDX7989451.1 tail fiber assembly protein [Xenorhabdus sp. 12]